MGAPMADRPGEDELLQKVVQEASLRSNTDTVVHAEIEMTYQILALLVKCSEDDRDLIRTAASIAITLHEPMDGHPFF
jgi:hypothetical protein